MDELLSSPLPLNEENTEMVDKLLRDPGKTGGSGMDGKQVSLADFIAGLRPVRRAVTIYARGDLLADIEVLIEQRKDAADRDEIDKQIAQLQSEVCSSALDLVFQGRSETSLKEYQDELRKEGKTETEIGYSSIASMIVEPEGADAAFVRTVFETTPSQGMLLMRAAQLVGSEPVALSNPFRFRPPAHGTKK